MPLVSIIIPAYNAELWIAESIGSVLAQTWRELEVIVVDDGSQDATPEIVAGIGDPRVRLIRQENRGAAAARNHGLKLARGNYLQFLDADDLLSADKLELQMIELDGAPPDSVASCGWGKFSFDPMEVRVNAEPVWDVADPVDWLVCSLSGGGMMQPGAWLCPRRVVERAGKWDESFSLHDDGEYFTRVLLQASRNIFVEGPIVYYREVSGSLSRSTSRKAMESALAVCRSRHQALFAARDTPAVHRAIATQYAQFIYQFGADAPDLANSALLLIEELNENPAGSIGGSGFRCLIKALGFERAWRLRRWIYEVLPR